LHVQGEREFAVLPLEVPRGAQVEAVAASAVGRLFAQQAGLVRSGFAVTAENAADVAAICARLDGLPLAIELAASRVRLLAPKALLARLAHGLPLAAAEAGRPLRQQTLRNTVAWSYELLTPELAQVFRRMSVFAGDCDLDALAAVAVTGGDLTGSDPLELVSELADVSLISVTVSADGEPRVGMLETIREYALERLEAEDDPDGAAPARRVLRGGGRTGRPAAGRPGAPGIAGQARGRAVTMASQVRAWASSVSRLASGFAMLLATGEAGPA
jgi:predicted ATPase